MLADVFFPDTIGGAGRVVYHLSLELSRKGHEVHIITRNTNEEFLTYEKLNPNLFVHRFFTPPKESPTLFLSEIKGSYLLSKKLSQKISFDLICIHQSMVAIGPFLSGYLKNIPLVYYYHSPWHEEFAVKKQKNNGNTGKGAKAIAQVMKRIEKRMLFKSTKVIVLSQYVINKLLAIHHYPEQNILRIHGGVDLNRFKLPMGGKTAAKDILSLSLNKTVFLTVRNLVPRMGIEELIKTFNRSDVLKQRALLLIGGRGFLENHLKSMVENFHLQNSIQFLGRIPDGDLPGIYQAADFFVLPTRKLEGFGLVILEAMACGTPVLGTPVGAIPEVIGPFDKKLLFDGTVWLDIKTKLEDVIERPEKYSFDPAACRNFVENNFSWIKMADSFENKIIKLIRC